MRVGGVIFRSMHVVVARRHRTTLQRGDRLVESAKYDRQIAIDGCQHEPGGNQPAQECNAEDEQRRPTWLLDVAHPFHHSADSGIAR
jgi:hypothetical protein